MKAVKEATVTIIEKIGLSSAAKKPTFARFVSEVNAVSKDILMVRVAPATPSKLLQWKQAVTEHKNGSLIRAMNSHIKVYGTTPELREFVRTIAQLLVNLITAIREQIESTKQKPPPTIIVRVVQSTGSAVDTARGATSSAVDTARSATSSAATTVKNAAGSVVGFVVGATDSVMDITGNPVEAVVAVESAIAVDPPAASEPVVVQSVRNPSPLAMLCCGKPQDVE